MIFENFIVLLSNGACGILSFFVEVIHLALEMVITMAGLSCLAALYSLMMLINL